MRKSSICGDIVKLVEKIICVVFFSYLASIKRIIHKIVTRTEILALVSLQWNAKFKKYKPNIGDMPKLMDK